MKLGLITMGDVITRRRPATEGIRAITMADFNRTPPQQHGLGRSCLQPGCGQPLSRYNPGQFCSCHEAGATMAEDERIANLPDLHDEVIVTGERTQLGQLVFAN